jgi:hypothetical protein
MTMKTPEKLFCSGCGSDRIIEFGEKSQIDGKLSHKCEACNLVMGPLRSRFVLWLVTLLALLLAIGCVGGFLLAVGMFVMTGVFPDGGKSVLVLTPFIGFTYLGFHELRQPVPRRVPISAQEPNG